MMLARATQAAGRWRLLAAAVLLGPALAMAGATAEIHIRDYKFDPPSIQIKAGTTVTWINHEKRTSHSVLFTGPGGFESQRMFPGESWSRSFDRPGVYPYTCGPHPEMSGVVEVTE